MTVDFGKGESIVVYGDNGTGKSTIADALEWYFTGQIELLSHEGRQHAVRYVGGEATASPRSRSSRTARSAGRLSSPTSGTPRRSTRSGAKPSCFADAPLQISSTRPKRRSGRRWSKSSAWTLSRTFEKTFSARGTSFARRPKPRKKRSEPTVEPWLRDPRKSPTTRFSPISSRSAECSVSMPPQSLDQVVDPSWLTAAVGASAAVSEASDRESLLAEIKTLSPPAFDRSALDAWNDLVSSDRARLLPRASLVREAKRLFDTGSIDKGRCPLCGQKVDRQDLARRIESALVDVMEASRDLERVRDPVAQQADDLEAAHAQAALDSQSRARHGARAATRARPPARRPQTRVEALAPIEIEAITSASVRPPQMGPRGWHGRTKGVARRNRARATRSSSCWPRCASR